MIPTALASDIRIALLDYLDTTFAFSDEALQAAFRAFLSDPVTGLFKGPYVSLRLPFRPAAADAPSPLTIAPPFTPYVHQQRSFARLHSAGGTRPPQPTLITTGTGSGKTECFLYPILDHCHALRGTPGIKAIILYPMNALASDQAGRLARAIWDDDRLRGHVSAGIYIGGRKQDAAQTLTAERLIEDRDVLRANPPDILLTNYKMLDFLLLRPEDRSLWQHNAPETLRYLVLDELHTYDGAQGSDVACLIRRLRARLGAAPCPVGTSATLGEGGAAGASAALIDFAGKLFGVPFGDDSVITEDRLTIDQFLSAAAPLPAAAQAAAAPLPAADGLEADPGEQLDEYLARQSVAWFGRPLDAHALAAALGRHPFLRRVLAVCGAATPTLAQAAAALDVDERQLASFLALIAAARSGTPQRPRPFLALQIQLWLREMSRLMHTVSADNRFFWRDERPDADSGPRGLPRGLPRVVCRDCGHSAWLALLRDGDERLNEGTRQIYAGYFERSRHVVYVARAQTDAPDAARPVSRICPHCLRHGLGERCPHCGVPTLAVHLDRALSNPDAGQPRDQRRCPVCQGEDVYIIVGSQAASLLSVAIGQLFTSPLNRDRKLLAFTDSVQDASHRAGFFGARTYRFGLRTALQGLLQTQDDLPLPAVAPALLNYFHARSNDFSRPARSNDFSRSLEEEETTEVVTTNLARSNDFSRSLEEEETTEVVTTNGGGQRLAAFFMPADLRDYAPLRAYLEGPPAPLPPDLRADLLTRLGWEATGEFGFNAALGRSLERVGVAVAYPDRDRLAQALASAHLVLSNEIATLRDLDRPTLAHFVFGLLERTRRRGGVHHALLDGYVHDNGNTWRLTGGAPPLLAPFPVNSPRYPRFLTTRGGNTPFDAVHSGGATTWFVDWARRALLPPAAASAVSITDINEIYRQLLPLLAEAGLLRSAAAGGATVYGVEPAALRLTPHATRLSCPACGQRVTVAAADAAERLGQPCPRFRCAGRLRPYTRQTDSYYRARYTSGHVERIFAAEHTGLLDRDTREQVETAFRAQQTADAPNLLVATPTLEMGIDIGDLSATVACSVPPTPANYVQRIGRAGRATGNALLVTMAVTRPHDLYFHAEPLEMIAGTVTPPGCFLDAPRMLARQYLAFALDSWVRDEPAAQALPRTVKDLLARGRPTDFPADWLAWYADRQAVVQDEFVALFDGALSPATQAGLRAFGARLPAAVTAAMAATAAERDLLRRERTAIKRQRDKIEADPVEYADPQRQIDRLNQEMRVLVRQIRVLEEKYILNFFTDAGLLPNYAFPESGVRLDVVIGARQARTGRQETTREYIRPAAAAIRELAPFNTFYAEGHKLAISHVNIAGQNGEPESWQFCARCHHLARVQSTHYTSNCPQCGDPLWHDAGQQHQMALLQQVAAWTDERRSLAGDDGDDRERQAYVIDQSFEIPPHDDVTTAAQAAETPTRTHAILVTQPLFGVEYHNAVTLREVNYGLADQHGPTFQVAGEPRPRRGYQICPSCGVVIDPRRDAAKQPANHTRQCLARSRTGEIKWADLFLYRELTSEALRILLPVSTFLVEEKLATFRAALALGIRQKFQGRADHLHIAAHHEVGHDGTRRRYLMLYDSVPGGTSFLRDLARPAQFRDLLQRALRVISTCDCRHDPQRAACYRCLYAYDTQNSLPLISRALAEEMLRDILDHWATMQPVYSLSEATLDSLLESELEQQLVDLLRARTADWQAIEYAGAPAWTFSVNGRAWLLQPQVWLGAQDGVLVPSRADFVLWPQGEGSETIRPVAVFCDGKAYHIRPQQPLGRIGYDLAQRQALIDSGSFAVWSLTWDDIEEAAGDMGAPYELLTPPQVAALKRVPASHAAGLDRALIGGNAVGGLLAWLGNPDAARWRELAALAAFAWLLPTRPPAAGSALAALHHAVQTTDAPPALDLADLPAGEMLYQVQQWPYLARLVSVPAAAVSALAAGAFALTLRLNDSAEARGREPFVLDWRRFWQMHNLLQWLPGATLTSTEALAESERPPASAAVPPTPDPWAQAAGLAPDCAELLAACRAAGLTVPVVGFELADSRAGYFAELAWPAARVAVFLPEQAADRKAFGAAGWQVLPAAGVPADVIAAVRGSAA